MRNICIALIATYLLIACSDGQQQSVSLEPRYQASLSEGITFNRDGYPSFVSSVKGISVKETFGRWTDGSQAVIEFTQALPKNFTLKIKSGVFYPWRNKPIKIIVGNTPLETRFIKDETTEVTIPVATDGNARSIIFELPDAKSPKELGASPDTRKLGLALVSLQIEQ
jgi:phosphoglycerol transferase